MRSRAVLACALASLGAFAASCAETPLLPRSQVVSPRILAVITEAPEVQPGQFVSIRVVTGGTSAPTFRWFVCARPEATTTFVASSTFGQAEPNSGCFPDTSPSAIPIGTGPEVFFGVPADARSQIEALAAIYGRSLSTESLLRIARTTGIALTIGVEMTDGATVVRGIKRLVVVQRADTNINPPPPAFTLTIGGDGGTRRIRMARSIEDPDACAPFPLQPLQVRHGQRIALSPESDDERWLESYDSYDSSGNITPLREVAFYSWYSTEGWFSSDRTRAPSRGTNWTAPYEDGTETLWLVVRDGRGGTSFCRFDIAVATP